MEERLKQVEELLNQGLSIQEIAARLGLKVSSVRTYISLVRRKKRGEEREERRAEEERPVQPAQAVPTPPTPSAAPVEAAPRVEVQQPRPEVKRVEQAEKKVWAFCSWVVCTVCEYAEGRLTCYAESLAKVRERGIEIVAASA